MDAARHHEVADRFADRAAIALSLALAARTPWRCRRLMREAYHLTLLALVHSNLTATERLIADMKKPVTVVPATGQPTPNPEGTES